MKKFLTLALLLSLGMFAIGCEKKTEAPATEEPAPETTEAPAE